MKNKWKVLVLGRKGTTEWEITVVHVDNKHGQESYGWYDNDKILVSTCDDFGIPLLREVWDGQIKLAKEICKKLNSGEIVPNYKQYEDSSDYYLARTSK